MPFSPVKAMLSLFALLFLFTFTTATPLPTDIALNATSLSTRQESNGIYYGSSCRPDAPLRRTHPNACWLSLSQKKDYDTWSQFGPPTKFNWATTLFIFRMDCTIIGYVPEINLETDWHSISSQLPWTVDIVTNNNVPQFNYAGQHIDAGKKDGFVEQWDENDSGLEFYNWRFLFNC